MHIFRVTGSAQANLVVEVAVRQGVLVFVEGIKEGSNLLAVDLHPDQKLLEALQVDDDHVFPFFRP